MQAALFCAAKPPEGVHARASIGRLGWIDIPLRAEGWNARRIPRLVAPEVVVTPPSGGQITRVRVSYAPDPLRAEGGPTVLRLVLPPWHRPKTPRPNLRCGMMTAYFQKGFSDAFDDAQTGQAFDNALRQLGCTALRFPGGGYAYGYVPFDRRCLPIYAAAKLGFLNYSYWDLSRWGWVGAEAFFRRCARLGLVAWYQLDPAFYCDADQGKAYQIAAFDRRENLLPVSSVARRKALADVERLARAARAAGAEVIWEIGNEDYCYFSPAAYCEIVAAFAERLRRVDPQARIAACGDSYSWSDLSWQAETASLLSARGLPDYWSVHLYLQGVWMLQGDEWVPRPWNTQLDVMTHAAAAWDAISQGLYRYQYRDNLWAHHQRAPLVITEFNVLCAGEDEIAKGHWMGRAIGEAAAYPGLAGIGEHDPVSVGVFFHDLVRSGDDQNWFQRLDYYPGLAPAHRYGFQADAAALSLMAHHARGEAFFREDGQSLRVLASFVPRGYYVTLVNLSQQPLSASLSAPLRAEAQATVLAGGEGEYDYGLETRALEHSYVGPGLTRWRVHLPPASLTAVFIGGTR